jgi:hypothetical protein
MHDRALDEPGAWAMGPVRSMGVRKSERGERSEPIVNVQWSEYK